MRILLLALGFLLVSVVVLPLLSITVGRLVIDDGIESFRGDPLAYKVARNAYDMAQRHRDSAFQRLVAPAGRVVAVTFKPGHCLKAASSASLPSSNDKVRRPALGKTSADPDAAVMREYTAQVRFHTFFGYPVEDVFLECGGDSAGGAPSQESLSQSAPNTPGSDMPI